MGSAFPQMGDYVESEPQELQTIIMSFGGPKDQRLNSRHGSGCS